MAVATLRCRTTTLVLHTLGTSPALVALTLPCIRRDVFHAARAATEAGHFFFAPGRFDENGNVTSFTQTSQSSIDLCAVLADP